MKTDGRLHLPLTNNIGNEVSQVSERFPIISKIIHRIEITQREFVSFYNPMRELMWRRLRLVRNRPVLLTIPLRILTFLVFPKSITFLILLCGSHGHTNHVTLTCNANWEPFLKNEHLVTL